MVIANADEPADGLVIVPMEDAIIKFGDQFEKKG